MKQKIIIALLDLLIAIQFFRPEQKKGQADTRDDITHAVQVPSQIKQLLKASCYDCHSNRTTYLGMQCESSGMVAQ